LSHPEGTDPQHFHLVAPFESDPRRWHRLDWANQYTASAERYYITTSSSLYAVSDEVRVKTYQDVLADYRTHPESKSLGLDGKVCARRTVGLLRRRPVTALYLTHVGKESNQLEEVEAGLVHDPNEIYTEYEDPAHAPWRSLVVPVLRQTPRRLIMEGTGLARSTVTALRNGHGVPHQQPRDALTRIAATFARPATGSRQADATWRPRGMCSLTAHDPE
jgi:hypothetical protein